MNIKVIGSGSSGNCYLIDDGMTRILLDAGLPIKEIRKGCDFWLSSVAGCFVTHEHKDHCKAVPDLVRAGVDVYMPVDEMAEYKGEPHRFHRIHPGDLYETGTFVILPFLVEHDTPNPVGYFMRSRVRGETLLYFTDTYSIRNTFPAVNYIIGECNYTSEMLWQHVNSGETDASRAKRLFKSHMSLESLLKWLEMIVKDNKSQLKQIYLCHMSDAHGDAEKAVSEVQKLTGCEVYVC